MATRRTPIWRWGPLACIAAGLCGVSGGAGAAPDRPLYERMGGEAVVTAIAGDVIDRALADDGLKRSFDGTNVARIKRLLAEQICSLSGGGCRYTGDTMRQVHAGHGISEAEFFGLVAALRRSMLEHGVRLRERNELLALLAPMKREIVEPPRPPRTTVPPAS